jgi:hypothetical protein
MADSDGLHAIGVQAIETTSVRKVSSSGKSDFFYNPMWRLYGHQGHDDAGAATHYWIGKWAHELGWHMLDQVVIRPSEYANFPAQNLVILTQVGTLSLLNTQGLPDQQTGSDHLPIVFHWNL